MYGPPAAGKDTVTTALAALDRRYRLFPRLKLGKGRTTGYRLTTADEVAELRSAGEILWENERYGATYFVDHTFLAGELSTAWPVLHLGQAPGIRAVRNAFRDAEWIVVHLWCPRAVAEQRVIARGTGDVAERMEAWDATKPIPDALFIDTSTVSAPDAAALIDAEVRSLQGSARTAAFGVGQRQKGGGVADRL
jgi:guanylate kinase